MGEWACETEVLGLGECRVHPSSQHGESDRPTFDMMDVDKRRPFNDEVVGMGGSFRGSM